MTLKRTYAIHEQPDGAQLTVNGKTYHCTVYLDRSRNIEVGVATSTTSIRAICTDIQDGGARTVVFHNTVATPTDDASIVDSPRIMARGSTFVVHWLESDDESAPGALIFRATMDMSSFSLTTWNNRGSSGLHDDLIYDAVPVEGHATDFIVTRKVTATSFAQITRFDGFDWVDTVYAVSTASAIAGRILACHASDTDGDVVIAYQGTGGGALRLFATRVDSATGLNMLSNEVAASFGNAHFFACWIERTVADRVVVCASAMRDALVATVPDRYCHWLVTRELNSANAVMTGTLHWTPHYHLVSRGWYHRGELYCVVGFKSVTDPDNWHQARAFVLALNYERWEDGDTGATVRPSIVATASSVGIPDARIPTASPAVGVEPYGEYPVRRMNHLTTPSDMVGSGVDAKVVTVPVTTFAKVGVVHTQDEALEAVSPGNAERSELAPENAGIVAYKIGMEDPWAYDAGVRENFRACLPRVAYQTVEAGRGLIVGGGAPRIYDGFKAVELGFPWAPEVLGVELTTDAGPTGLTLGMYQCYFVYAWVDKQGQTHRSAPSKVFTFWVAAPETRATYRVRTMSGSERGPNLFTPTDSPIVLELYRTTSFDVADITGDADYTPGSTPIGGPFYRVYGSADPASVYQSEYTPTNDPTVHAVDVDDAVIDTDLIYQGLGPYQFSINVSVTPIPPQAVPSMSVVAVWRNRLWMATGEDTATIWYSKEIRPDYGSDYYQAPELCDTNTFRIDGIEEVVAMQAMSDTLVVFTRNGIGTIVGEGNDDAGTGATLTFTQRHEGTGCIDPRSVVLAPPGVFFQSQKGYYMLDLGFALHHIGAGADTLIREAGNIQSVALLEDRHQIRLTCNGIPIYRDTVELDVTIGATPGTFTVTFTIDGEDYDIEAEFTGGMADAAAAEALVDAINAATVPDGVLFGHVSVASFTGDAVFIAFADNETADIAVSPGPELVFVETATALIDRNPLVLIYDYLRGAWTSANPKPSDLITFDQSQSVGGCSWRRYRDEIAHVALFEAGLMLERAADDADAFTDMRTTFGTDDFSIDVRTAWIHLAGIAGFKRLWEVGVSTERLRSLGMNPNYGMAADLEYDVDGAYSGEYPATDEYTWAAPAPAYLPMRPSNQQCSAVRVRVYEPVGTLDDTFAITAIVLDVGAIKGARRHDPATRGQT